MWNLKKWEDDLEQRIQALETLLDCLREDKKRIQAWRGVDAEVVKLEDKREKK